MKLNHYLGVIAALAAVAYPVSLSARAGMKSHVVDWTAIVAATPQGGMRMGNPNAPVELVEFGSRVCSHCARFAIEGLSILKSKYIATGRVSYEFRDFPVAGALDLGPILLGRCVPATQYFPVLDRMYHNQDALLGKVSEVSKSIAADAKPNDVAMIYASKLGYLDLMQRAGFARSKMISCLQDRRAIVRIVREVRIADQVDHVVGTPTFEINGRHVDGVFEWDALRLALDAALNN